MTLISPYNWSSTVPLFHNLSAYQEKISEICILKRYSPWVCVYFICKGLPLVLKIKIVLMNTF